MKEQRSSMEYEKEYEKPKIEIILWQDDIILGHSIDEDDDNLEWDEF